MKKLINLSLSVVILSFSSCSDKNLSPNQMIKNDLLTTQDFYSADGVEVEVEFEAIYRTRKMTLEELQRQQMTIQKYEIPKATQFLFGPLTHRQLGGIQKGEKVEINLEQSQFNSDKSLIHYNYRATWVLSKELASEEQIELPLPYSHRDILTENWKTCTDSSPGHQDSSVFWYYWDPTRYGCKQIENIDYQIVKIKVLNIKESTTETYPEYERLFRIENDVPTMHMTFAFGYVEDEVNSNPFKSSDWGMKEFRKFLAATQRMAAPYNPVTRDIYLSYYDTSIDKTQDKIIGQQIEFSKDDKRFIINISTSTDVDQMDIFATSFSETHESFFAWFGHSRVGSGFDAMMFSNKLNQDPERFSLTDHYQIIYWAGCNSYSYYTLPFFDLKKGSKNLDIISNGLPSYFHYNADSGLVALNALIHPEKKLSYQQIVRQIESRADREGVTILSNVLGDEDNLK